ncbi:MAG: hypothetical protein ACREMD_15400 [Gemmatimonadota bacterium]
MADTPIPPWKLLAAAMLVLAPSAGPALAQSDAAQPEGFRRQYLDADAYRTGGATLREWPSLGALVRWSRELERAVAEDDETLSGALLAEFRTRVDSFATESLPAFMAPSADSVDAAIDSLGAHLDRAEAWLEALPPAPTPTGDEAVNEAARKRTLVTGRTAVTVPAGVKVGAEDSLPTAALPGEEENFLDLVNLALADLDRLVHLVRTTGRPETEDASGSPSTPEPKPSADTERPLREP